MFGFHGILPRAAPLLMAPAPVVGTGAVTFDAMTVAGTAAVATTATGGLMFSGLLTRGIPPRHLLLQRLTRSRR